MSRMKIKRYPLPLSYLQLIDYFGWSASHVATLLGLKFETQAERIALQAALRGDPTTKDLYNALILGLQLWMGELTANMMKAGWDPMDNRVGGTFEVPRMTMQVNEPKPWPEYDILPDDHPVRVAARRHMQEDFDLLAELSELGIHESQVDLAKLHRFLAMSPANQETAIAAGEIDDTTVQIKDLLPQLKTKLTD